MHDGGRRWSRSPRDARIAYFELAGASYLVVTCEEDAVESVAGLTKAEAEVLRSALRGLTSLEIALARNRSLSTVKKQLESAYRKLGVSSRAEAAASLEAHGGDVAGFLSVARILGERKVDEARCRPRDRKRVQRRAGSRKLVA